MFIFLFSDNVPNSDPKNQLVWTAMATFQATNE